MPSSQKELRVIIDIGASKISACVLNLSTMAIVMKHCRPYEEGVRAGFVLNHRKLVACISLVIQSLEEKVGVRLKECSVLISGAGTGSRIYCGDVKLPTHQVRHEDVSAIKSLCIASASSKDRALIYYTPITYNVDKIADIRDPIGMTGSHLGVRCNIISVDSSALINVASAIVKAGLAAANYHCSIYLLARAYLKQQERVAGALLIEMGASATQAIWMVENKPVFVCALHIGGTQITKDIMYAFGTDFEVSQKLKYTADLSWYDTLDTSLVNIQELKSAGSRIPLIKRHSLAFVIRERIEEIMDLLYKKLEDFCSEFSLALPIKNYLCGRVAHMEGLELFLEKRVNRRIRCLKEEALRHECIEADMFDALDHDIAVFIGLRASLMTENEQEEGEAQASKDRVKQEKTLYEQLKEMIWS